MPKKSKNDMTPAQSKEELSQLLEMQLEEADLKSKLDKVTEAHKEAKAKWQLKADEILDHLRELNVELPLFDKPEETPWPFPVPDYCFDATLGNIAVEPNVEGLTTGIVKHVREAYGTFTLGGLQKQLNASEKMSNDQMTKAKKAMGERLGANSAVKLLRAIASFTGSRKKKPEGKKADKKPDPIPVEKAPEAKPLKDAAWRNTRLTKLLPDQEVVLKHMASKDVITVGDVLDLIDSWNQQAKEATGIIAPNTSALAMVQAYGMGLAIAKKIVKVVLEYEEENTITKK